jgi:phosphoribosyl-ATP pyrophosphohydrolase
VLTLAYSSPTSLRRALREGHGAYFSRSRQKIWIKGETSGNTQTLVSCRADCDRDTLLFTVKQHRVACHAGAESCFQAAKPTLPKLFETLQQRLHDRPPGSYTTRLYEDSELLRAKILEEAEELVDADTFETRRWEAADLLYHAAVYAARHGIAWKDIEAELRGRERSESKETP